MAGGESKSLVTLEKYVDTRFEDLKKHVDTRFDSLKDAVTVANLAMDRRLESMNELRAAMNDYANRMMTKAEWTGEMKLIYQELQALREFRVSLEAKASQKAMYVTLAISLASLLLAIIKNFR